MNADASSRRDRIFWIIFITATALLAGLIAYHALVLLVIEVSCSYYKSSVHETLWVSLPIVGLLSFIIYSAGIVRCAKRKQLKQCLALSAGLILFILAGFGLFSADLFYCSFGDLGPGDLEGFYWGPH